MEKNLLKLLEKLILPVSAGWEITNIEIDDNVSEVYVSLSFTDSTYKHEDIMYKI